MREEARGNKSTEKKTFEINYFSRCTSQTIEILLQNVTIFERLKVRQ